MKTIFISLLSFFLFYGQLCASEEEKKKENKEIVPVHCEGNSLVVASHETAAPLVEFVEHTIEKKKHKKEKKKEEVHTFDVEVNKIQVALSSALLMALNQMKAVIDRVGLPWNSSNFALETLSERNTKVQHALKNFNSINEILVASRTRVLQNVDQKIKDYYTVFILNDLISNFSKSITNNDNLVETRMKSCTAINYLPLAKCHCDALEIAYASVIATHKTTKDLYNQTNPQIQAN